MLFSYSPDGFHDNWLHETLIETLATDMAQIDGGLAPVAWPACIAAPHREALRPKHGLRDRRATLLDRYAALAPPDRAQVREAMNRQNALPAILDDGLPCLRLGDLPEQIRAPVKDFFEFAFGLLTGLGLRDENYKRIYDQLAHKVCAFCGLELLDAPGQKREALDHYLQVSDYPFAGANFRNLSPMGTKCNSRYKLQQDILFDPASGARRACCDPFGSPTLMLSLNDSRPFEGPRVNLVTCPDWDIKWVGGDPGKLQTWETVFGISERYRESSLNPNFRSWIDHFCEWAVRKPVAATPDLLRDLLYEFADIVVPEGFADSAFLKRATFQMLAIQCDTSDNGLRIFDWLHDLIEERRPLAA